MRNFVHKHAQRSGAGPHKTKTELSAQEMIEEQMPTHLSYSQLGQDILVTALTQQKHNGYFVEFGATNGKTISNTYLLESEYQWTGILAEPAVCWHEALRANRTAHIETKCVWSSSNEVLLFNQVEDKTFGAELSTIDDFSECDGHAIRRKAGKHYQVETISLLDLLIKYNAPKEIDYLSIDTEGSEFEILNAFDFSQYKFNIITVEHNYTQKREKIYNLLTSNGYKRIFTQHSKWDDWYVAT